MFAIIAAAATSASNSVVVAAEPANQLARIAAANANPILDSNNALVMTVMHQINGFYTGAWACLVSAVQTNLTILGFCVAGGLVVLQWVIRVHQERTFKDIVDTAKSDWAKDLENRFDDEREKYEKIIAGISDASSARIREDVEREHLHNLKQVATATAGMTKTIQEEITKVRESNSKLVEITTQGLKQEIQIEIASINEKAELNFRELEGMTFFVQGRQAQLAGRFGLALTSMMDSADSLRDSRYTGRNTAALEVAISILPKVTLEQINSLNMIGGTKGFASVLASYNNLIANSKSKNRGEKYSGLIAKLEAEFSAMSQRLGLKIPVAAPAAPAPADKRDPAPPQQK